ncbi:unnamed protein product [Rotaria socialis]|uniref:EF-hand domain-containing protein n=1 Tax=Rotaria socialis TaxID=392032 RepID=A0A818PR08_9BILA|nr:unnamed protein product [Rotaria socialis]CAF3624823.1 unnamed protein product [Rotaria socialis]CAF4161171.1 unnamed protein product [Rotaria socialis]CAF4598312.1 unnamed protein product [Rotaria socialis]
MGDKPRLSVASSTGLKNVAAINQFKRLYNQQSISSFSNHEDTREDRIELENLLGTDQLEKLRTQGFSESKVLDKESFIRFLRHTLNRGSDRDYEELFECVDVTKEGVISWDKLATYLMLKLYDNDDREKASSVPNWKSGKNLMNAHRDSVKRIQHMDSFNRYISISKEGTVCIYNDEMQLYKTFKAGTESCKIRDLWITDFVLMTNVNKVAVAYTSKELIIYDMTSKLELSLAYRIVGIDSTPYCLDYWSDTENPNDAILSWGDVKGDVHAILFNSAIIALFERPPQQTNNAAYTRVQLEDIENGIYKNASYLTYHAHAEWTRQIKYADHLECFISCSTNTKTALVFGWMDKSGLTVRVNYSVRIRQLREVRNVVEINQGLNSFDYSRNFNLIATAGVNYQVSLWNPFVLSKPNGILRGHMRSVLYVQFIPSRGQLLSFSKDKILRIWDVQLQICLQRLSNIFPRGPEGKRSKKILLFILFF